MGRTWPRHVRLSSAFAWAANLEWELQRIFKHRAALCGTLDRLIGSEVLAHGDPNVTAVVLPSTGVTSMRRLSTLMLGVLALVLVLGLALPVIADEASGKVKTVNGDKNQFVMTDAGGKDLTITLNKDGKVFINDKAGKLSDLQAGDEVKVTCEIKNDQHHASEVRVTRK
jgi:hypothetical protein